MEFAVQLAVQLASLHENARMTPRNFSPQTKTQEWACVYRRVLLAYTKAAQRVSNQGLVDEGEVNEGKDDEGGKEECDAWKRHLPQKLCSRRDSRSV